MGGGATVFKLNTNGSGYAELAPVGPVRGLVVSGATLYGTTFRNDGVDHGTVFKVNTDGSGYTELKSFTGADGHGPFDGVLESDSVLYGTTVLGGASSYGTVFKVNTDGTGFAVLHHFTGSDGARPYAGLALRGTTLYGTTVEGSSSLFKINTDGSGFTVLKAFSPWDGSAPYARLVCSGTTLYGMMNQGGNGLGVVFKVNIDGDGYTVLHRFTGSDGANPSAPVVLSSGRLYGTTFNGGSGYSGSGTGNGTVFSLSVALPSIVVPPVSQSAVVGSTVDFSVKAEGFEPLSYQWVFDSTNVIAGATNALLHLSSIQFSRAGAYAVIVTNVFGSATSSPALLDVIAGAPTIVTPPPSQTNWTGATVDFAVDAAGSPPLVYQWFFNITNTLLGATNSALHLTNVQSRQSGTYTVVVTNALGAATSSPAMLVVLPPGTVPVCTEAALRGAMAGGDTVTFACDGTITLADTITVETNTVLDGTGHQVTLSGGNAVRVFSVNTNVTFTVINVTIAEGQSTNGAGILNNGGTLNLVGARLRNNVAAKSLYGPEYSGGGVFNRGGTVNATNCVFLGNAARARNAGVLSARGGAIDNESGLVNLQSCAFIGNSASGGPALVPGVPASGGDGTGGAIHNAGTLHASRCTFVQNSTSGGVGLSYPGPCSGCPGSAGGNGAGGAICNLGLLAVEGCTFASNAVTGGNGEKGSYGASCFEGGDMTGGRGGAGGCGYGGALFNGGLAHLTNTTFAWNRANGGTGDAGGGGGSCVRSGGVGGAGGAGGNGGFAFGAVSGQADLTACTVAFNSGTGGHGGAGGGGGSGSGLPGSTGPAGATGAEGDASGGLSGAWLVNTLLATNVPANNRYGTITDAGRNLSSDASCAFTGIGSLNNTDPKLGPLGNNGGPTLTMALLPSSPAIDAGDPGAAPPTDQRGGARPAGTAPDIGAYEYGSLPILRIGPPQAGAFDLVLGEVLVPSCRLLTSTNFANWLPMATNQIGADRTALFHVNVDPADAQRFYRLALP